MLGMEFKMRSGAVDNENQERKPGLLSVSRLGGNLVA